MATLPTIKPYAYLAQTGTAWVSTTVANIQNDDANFITSGNDPTTTIDYSLDDMPSDFSSMTTLTVWFDLNLNGLKNDSTVVYARVYDASNNPLTNEMTLASTASNESSVAMTGVVASNKTTWDGAKVRLRIQHSTAGQPDGLNWTVGYVWFTGTYASTATPMTDTADGAAALAARTSDTADGSAALQKANTDTADGSAHLSAGATPMTDTADGSAALSAAASDTADGSAMLTKGVTRSGLVAEYVAAYAKGEGTFGNETTGSYIEQTYPNSVEVSKFTLADAASITKLTYRLTNDTAQAWNFKGVIYSDDGGYPDTLLGVTGATSCPVGSDQDIEATFSVPVELEPGTYWLGMVVESWNGFKWRYDWSYPDEQAYFSGGYSDPPATADSPSLSTKRWCVYATYTCSAPGNNTDPTEEWADLVGDNDGALAGFAYTTSSGWDGDGSANDPYALVFAGTDDAVDCGDRSAGEDKTCSYEAWFATTSGGANQELVGDHRLDGGSRSNTVLKVNAGKLQGQQSDESYNTATVEDAASTNDGAWHHGVLTIDGSWLRLYLDGELVDGPTAVTAGTVTQADSSIGARTGGGGTWVDLFVGAIATARVYDRALTADEVADNYTAGVRARSHFGTADGSAALAASTSDTADGAAVLQAALTDTADGSAHLVAPGGQTDTADGSAALQKATSDTADGSAALQAAATDTADGSAALLAQQADTADGAAALQAAATDTADGAAVLLAQHTDTADGSAALEAAKTDSADGAAVLYRVQTDAADGAAALQGAATDTADGAAHLVEPGAQLDTADGSAALQAALTDTADGAAALAASSTDTADGAAVLYSAKTDSADGAAVLLAEQTDAADGSAHLTVPGAQSDTADGAAFLQKATTDTADGSAVLLAEQTDAADGSAALADHLTDTADGAAVLLAEQTDDATGAAHLVAIQGNWDTADGSAALQGAATDTADGSAALQTEVTGDATGAAVLLAQQSATADGAAALRGAATETADGAAALQASATDTADGSAELTYWASLEAQAAGAAFIIRWDVVFEVGAPESAWRASILDPDDGPTPAGGWRVDEPDSGWAVSDPR